MFKRLQTLPRHASESCFLWGPRQTGKSTLLRTLFPQSPFFDLLKSDLFERFNKRPAIFREELQNQPPTHSIIVDEIQLVPALLQEIHWLIENKKMRFILCGSSARKIKRSGVHLLGGRALRYEMFPLVFPEIKGFDLHRALTHGLIPRMYLSESPHDLLGAYVGDYLREEIAAEALSRRVPLFGRFLEAAVFSDGEVVNYQNVASECGVSGVTVKHYFEILEDTLLGHFLHPYRKKPKRRLSQAPKFYFFDLGIANYLLRRNTLTLDREIFGKVFEHFIYQELAAHRHYSGVGYPLSFWRTFSQLEVDFVLGEAEVALEIKGVPEILPRHLKGLKAFQEDYAPKKCYMVSLDPRPRVADGIAILPWKEFLEQLWSGAVIQ